MDGVVVAESSEVLSFDERWFDRIMADAALDGLGAMLIAQGGVTVKLRSDERSRGASLLRLVAICALIVVPLLLMWPSLTIHRFYGMRNLPLRRKRQTA